MNISNSLSKTFSWVPLAIALKKYFKVNLTNFSELKAGIRVHVIFPVYSEMLVAQHVTALITHPSSYLKLISTRHSAEHWLCLIKSEWMSKNILLCVMRPYRLSLIILIQYQKSFMYWIAISFPLRAKVYWIKKHKDDSVIKIRMMNQRLKRRISNNSSFQNVS